MPEYDWIAHNIQASLYEENGKLLGLRALLKDALETIRGEVRSREATEASIMEVKRLLAAPNPSPAQVSEAVLHLDQALEKLRASESIPKAMMIRVGKTVLNTGPERLDNWDGRTRYDGPP